MSLSPVAPASWLSRAAATLALLVGLAAFAGTARAADDPPGRVGRIAWVEGDARLRHDDGTPAVEHREDNLRNWPVTGGDRLSVGRDSRAEIAIGSTRLRLGEDSELTVTALDDDRIVLELVEGSLAIVLRSDEVARELSIETVAGRLSPSGAGLFRVDVPAPRRGEPDTASATAWRQALLIEQPGVGRQTLRPGQRAELYRDGGWRLTTPESDAFARWAMTQDSARPLASRDDPVPSEMTGADELDEHGDWTRAPEYGWVWFPRRVGPSWAPYRDGRWVWVRPWGWTWIDDAPWGYAPSHYGRWVWWRDRWGWVPGDWTPRPVWAPALVVWNGNPGVSWSVSIGSGVAWYPLAPREVYVPSFRVGMRYVQAVNRPHVHDDRLMGRVVERPDEVLRGTPFRYSGFRAAISVGDGLRGRVEAGHGVIRAQPWRDESRLPPRVRAPEPPPPVLRRDPPAPPVVERPDRFDRGERGDRDGRDGRFPAPRLPERNPDRNPDRTPDRGLDRVIPAPRPVPPASQSAPMPVEILRPAPRVEPPQPERQRPEGQRPEFQRPDMQRHDNPRPQPPQVQPAAPVQQPAPRLEPPRIEAARPEMARPQPMRPPEIRQPDVPRGHGGGDRGAERGGKPERWPPERGGDR
ncbi:DUF6600 domain-containing protein [Leptothrix discophora]|uniref:FecR protein domain-containing protein n=1 Tax=Leptothrix discophora TaxID=89 RepID=A0ABT9FZR6_LEPDI|nr:DUF6600 domain-containing protein [Leptothrix discophora]MDP4299722.1 hypothetical protein [Leptothrix discophora]